MNYLHYTFKAAPHNRVIITLNEKANVMLLDTLNYYKYRKGKSCMPAQKYINTPSFNFSVPFESEWHVIVEHGEFHGMLKAIVDVTD